MRVVAALLPMKILLAIATRIRRWSRAVLGAEAFGAGPRLQQRAVDREMLGREQHRHLRMRQHCGKELHRDIARQEPVAVLGTRRRVPYRIIHAEADEPAEQQIELDPLDQLALRTERVERLQQQRPEQAFRWDRFPTKRRVKRVKLRRQLLQRRVDDLTDHPQRMVRTNSLLQVHVAEQRPRNPVVPAHPQPRLIPNG